MKTSTLFNRLAVPVLGALVLETVRIFTWQNELTWTNNATEQVIGRM